MRAGRIAGTVAGLALALSACGGGGGQTASQGPVGGGTASPLTARATVTSYHDAEGITLGTFMGTPDQALATCTRVHGLVHIRVQAPGDWVATFVQNSQTVQVEHTVSEADAQTASDHGNTPAQVGKHLTTQITGGGQSSTDPVVWGVTPIVDVNTFAPAPPQWTAGLGLASATPTTYSGGDGPQIEVAMHLAC